MKNLLLIFLVAMLGCGNAFSQAKKTPVKRTQTNVSAKAKAEAEEKARNENNAKCSFSFATAQFVSNQNSEDFVVYEIPDMSASELKSAVFTTLSSMYNSPKDAITNLSDNIIQLEGYAKDAYNDSKWGYDIAFNIVIQFKDGKVRYNSPTIKQIWQGYLMLKKTDSLNMNISLASHIESSYARKKVEDYFNNLITSINTKLKKSNDW